VPYRAYERLKSWQQAIELVAAIHRLTPRLPANEKSTIGFALGRSSVGLPATIAAAVGQGEPALEKAYDACLATLREIDTHLHVAHRLRALSKWQTHGVRRRCRRLERRIERDLALLDEPILAQLDELDEPIDESAAEQRGPFRLWFNGSRTAA